MGEVLSKGALTSNRYKANLLIKLGRYSEGKEMLIKLNQIAKTVLQEHDHLRLLLKDDLRKYFEE